jgi:hypothetical protein
MPNETIFTLADELLPFFESLNEVVTVAADAELTTAEKRTEQIRTDLTDALLIIWASLKSCPPAQVIAHLDVNTTENEP